MFSWIVDTVNALGYAGVALLMALENLFPPIPSEIIMPLAGYAAAKGDLSLPGVIAAGTVGSVLGTLPIYFMGRRLGEERLKQWVDRHGKWLTVSAKEVERAADWFERHGGRAVFIGRLVPGLRSLIALPAGIERMHLGLFLLYDALGAALWTAVLAGAGYLLQAQFDRVAKVLDPASYVVFGGLAVWYVWRVVKQHRQGRA